ncbi:PucR family transcriptional regulator [Sciscionella marina]|uniref:PucR family transcriptional regulator n=1 Tax=Sciscionella marina TaxID=508770 RepID=UPI00035EA665|nr:helix-turn-helix domain-containing protein [Sciscionella marina]
MASDLQRLVDHLGARLRRSVAIDDAHIRLLAYTAHTGDVDRVRVESIMRRSVSRELIAYIKAHGAGHEGKMFTLPASSSLGLDVDRIGMPIRYQGSPLGYLWLIGSEGPVVDQALDAVSEAAGQAALILHGEFLTFEVARGRERELVRDLLSPDGELRADAAGRLVEEDIAVDGPVSAVVAAPTHKPGQPPGEQARLALQIAMDHGRRRLPPKHALTLNRPDHSLLLVTWSGSVAAAAKSTQELAMSVHERLTVELGGDEDPSCWVGTAQTRPSLAEAYRAYREARNAADIAQITGVLGTIVCYDRLGVYALFAKLPPEELAEGIHEGIRPLLDEASGHQDLMETLQSYLHNAGDSQRTSSQLHIHRATLYQRLRRIEKLTGLDLSRGDDRLAAHLSVKLARLTRLL